MYVFTFDNINVIEIQTNTGDNSCTIKYRIWLSDSEIVHV